MKRSNLLMGSYVSFIIICVIVRTFYEYPMWNAVVAAVTFSSAFFAYADFFFAYSCSLLEISNVADEFIEVTKKRLEVEAKTFTEINKKIDCIHKEKFDFSEMIEVIKPIRIKHDEMVSWLDGYVEDTLLKRKKAKNDMFISKMLTFGGHLFFLCVLVFLPITNVVVKAQDVLSVIAFAVILASYLIGTNLNEKLEKDKIQSYNAKKNYEDNRMKLKEIMDKLVEEIDYTKE